MIFLNAAGGKIHAQANRQPWTKLPAAPKGRAAAELWVNPQMFQAVALDHANMRAQLARAPMEAVPGSVVSDVEITLPMPDGTMQRFRIVESPVMAPELAAKFPEIKTYLGQGIDDPAASVRLDMTPAGFHAQILSPHGAVYIDPHLRDRSVYASYYKRDHRRNANDFICLTKPSPKAADQITPGGALARSGGNLRTYRLAVAATGEYTAFHGGTESAGLSAIVTAVNRVTGIYEIELAIRLTLVANNNLLVYTNSNTDPYSNNNASSLLSQNQANLDSVIGSANYDIGHVFSTAGGGLAGLGVVCSSSSKAQGETGLTSPIGDDFYIDYVAHEMGHQFGADHTFNSSTSNCGGGNRNVSTAYEPGSGSTIMAYAGICGSDDLQPHSDPYFHSISFDEIVNFTTTGSGNGCAALTSTGNSVPTVSAGSSYSIPASTPFILTASGSDPNGDALTYCWEERDLGPSITVTAADNGSSPLFRVFNPTTNTWRMFPKLSDILNNTTTTGEKLPTTSRTMTFRVTARDNRAGGGGVNTSDTTITVVSAAGPFTVTSHGSGGTFSNSITVTWNVAGTTASPISAANVKISLSTDGGQTFPTVLLASTPNDGSQVVTLPSITTSTARIKVEGVGNIFFDINAANFSIVPGIPTPQVVVDSVAITGESCGVGNGAIDPGESVTVLIGLKNVGSANTTNLVASLLATNGVTVPSTSQNYGALVAGGSAVTQSFSFTATGSCGGTLTMQFGLLDGAANLGDASQAVTLGGSTNFTTSFTNASAIDIPNNGTKGKASVFPSTISVSGVTGSVSKVTLSVRGLTHSWVGDVDFLLVGPGGQKLLFMSDAGDDNTSDDSVSNATFTFDDNAGSSLPSSGAATSGTYRPTNIDPAGDSDSFSSPAPDSPYSTALSAFNGVDATGTWSLYIQDDANQDTGTLVNGWTLTISSQVGVCCQTPVIGADLSVTASASLATVNVTSNLIFTINVTNAGPSTATNAVVTDTLPAGLSFVSASASQGTVSNDSGIVTATLGALAAAQSASVSIVVNAAASGSKTNVASVSSDTADSQSGNNSTATVLAVNSFPTISALTNQTTSEDVTTAPIAFTVGDAETAAQSLAGSAASSNTNLVPQANLVLGGTNASRTLTITPATNQSGSATITVHISDGLAAASASFLLTVNPVNDAPQLSAISNRIVVEGSLLSFTVLATDVEAPPQTLAFSLAGVPAGAEINPTNGGFTWTPTEPQGPSTNPITVIVSDDGSPSLSATQTFMVFVLETNGVPVLGGILDQILDEGGTLVITNSATDSDDPANVLTFSLDPGAPTNAVINPTNGVLTWTPTEAQGPGTNSITVRVMDNGSPAFSDVKTFSVVVNEINEPPVLATIADMTVAEGTTLTFTNVVIDPDIPANTFTFSFDSTPPVGANLDTNTGIFSWMPTEAQSGTTNIFTIRVTDFNPSAVNKQQLSDAKTFTVIVLESNEPPVLAAIADRTIHAGTTLLVTNSATDPDVPTNTLSFSLDAGAPAGAAIDSTNGIFSWTSDNSFANTTNPITVRVTDNGAPALSDAKTFNVTVVPPPLFQLIYYSNDVVTMTWSAIAGQTYRVLYKEDIDATNWSDLLPDVTAGGATASKDDSIISGAQRYYRIIVLP